MSSSWDRISHLETDTRTSYSLDIASTHRIWPIRSVSPCYDPHDDKNNDFAELWRDEIIYCKSRTSICLCAQPACVHPFLLWSQNSWNSHGTYALGFRLVLIIWCSENAALLMVLKENRLKISITVKQLMAVQSLRRWKSLIAVVAFEWLLFIILKFTLFCNAATCTEDSGIVITSIVLVTARQFFPPVASTMMGRLMRVQRFYSAKIFIANFARQSHFVRYQLVISPFGCRFEINGTHIAFVHHIEIGP